jgi:hypothetical protein
MLLGNATKLNLILVSLKALTKERMAEVIYAIFVVRGNVTNLSLFGLCTVATN